MVTEPKGDVPDRQTRRHRALSSISRIHILRTLNAHERSLDVHELSGIVDLHFNTVRAHLRVLEDANLVASQPESRSGPGRPRIVYRALADAADTGDPEGYRLLAGMLAGYLAGSSDDPAARAEEAGRGWGRYLTQGPPPFSDISADQSIDQLVEFFAELGFEPDRRVANAANGTEHIDLNHCPFREVAQVHPEVVCSLHLGLLRGALEQLQAPLRGARLRPFVEPGLCVADLDY